MSDYAEMYCREKHKPDMTCPVLCERCAAAEIERLREMIDWMENVDPRLVNDARDALTTKGEK